VRTNPIQIDDIIEARVKGRTILGRVTQVEDGVVHFHPICPGAGWRHAKAREIVAHWRRTGRRSGKTDNEADPSPGATPQLSFTADPE
jgi:hypothetical protein